MYPNNRLRAIFGLCALALTASTGFAAVIDVADVNIGGNNYRAFQDVDSNRVWLDLDNFLNYNGNPQSFDSLTTLLAGSGYRVATLADVQALNSSMTSSSDTWLTMAQIMGGNYAGSSHMPGNRSLMWGIYEDAGTVDYAYRFSSDSEMHYAPDINLSFTEIFSDRGLGDLGAWVVSDASAATPEPGSVFLLGAGMAGLAIGRRRAKNTKARQASSPDGLCVSSN